MTEAERVMEKGFLRKDFLQEENICDFFVDKKRKKIWAIELDLLCEFDRVCKKYGLKYFLMYGSLLGAIRHNGFIPWDDDLDVAMFREDYERFIEVANSELSEPYFLQTPYTDRGYFYSFIKLRNTNTTAISKAFQYQPYNQGIFLDIFPLDYCESKEFFNQYEEIKRLILINSKWMRLTNPECDIDADSKREILATNPMVIYEEIQRLAKMYYKEPKEYVAVSVFTVYDWKSSLFKLKDFEKTVEYDFEGMKVPIPIGWGNILSGLYGNYMEFPDKEQRGGWHKGAFFEPDVAYKEFVYGKC